MTKKRIFVSAVCLVLLTLVFCSCSSTDILQSYRYKISETDLSLKVGDGYDLSVIGASSSDISGLSMEWSSGDEKIASVDDTGFVVANSEGKTEISVHVTSTENNPEKIDVTYKCGVSVSKNGVVLKQFEYEDGNISIVRGQTFTPRLTVYPGNADNKNYTVTSSDENIVKIENDGKITGMEIGTAVITAKTDDGSFETSASVTVSAEKNLVESFVLNKTELTLNKGETETLNATVRPSNLGLEITWSSSDTSVISVNSKGTVTAVGEGTATVTATVHDILSEKTASCEITVKDRASQAVTSLRLDSDSLTISNGDSGVYNFGVSVIPSTASGNVLWSSSNTSVISINSKTGDFKLAGSVTQKTDIKISCRAGTISVTGTVTVLPGNAAAENIKVTPSMKADWKNGEKGELKLEFSPDIPDSEKERITVDIDDGGFFDISRNSFGSYTLTATSEGSGVLKINVSSASGEYSYSPATVNFTVAPEKTSYNSVSVRVIGSSLNYTVGSVITDWLTVTADGISVSPEEASVSFESSDVSVATVNSSGHITAVGSGTAKISVIRNSKVLVSVTVNVSEPVGPVCSISADKTEITADSPAAVIIAADGASINYAYLTSSDSSLVVVSAPSGNGSLQRATVSLSPDVSDYEGREITVKVTVILDNGEVKSEELVFNLG